ncbi:MAG TPA: site-specific integrase [Polyangiaceae bacterium]
MTRAKAYAELETRAPATRHAYRTDFRSFEGWCGERGFVALPASPATIGVYLAALAGEGRRTSTLERALSGIGDAHRVRGYPWHRAHPAIADVLRGIRRRHGVAPAQKAPVGDGELARMLEALGGDLVDHRDRAVLTLGWMGAFRRSELVALRVEDLVRTPEGLMVRMRRSKGDQEGRGVEKAIPYAAQTALCAVRALEGWLEASGVTEGPLLRAVARGGQVAAEGLCDRTVARIIKRAAAKVGLDPARLAGHSLRAGFATTAAKKGKTLDAIVRQTGHRSERVARSYIRPGGVFEGNAAVGLL